MTLFIPRLRNAALLRPRSPLARAGARSVLTHLLVLIYLLLLPSSALFAQAYPIVEIRVTGSEVYEPPEVIAYTGLKVDRKAEVPLDQIQAAAQKLAQSGVFQTVDYKHLKTQGGMLVQFTLTDHPQDQFVKAQFQNLVWIAPEELKTELEKRLPLYNGEVPLTGTLADEVGREVETLLAAKGVTAHVAHEFTPRTPESAPVAKYSVEDVNIVVASVEAPGTSPELLPEAQAAAKPLVNGTYQLDVARRIAQTMIRDVFLKNGFLQVKVGEPAPRILENTPGETRIALVLPVTQGEIYNFSGSLKWSGNSALPPAQLQHLVHLYPGISVDGWLLNHEVQDIRVEYARRGFLHMTMNAKPAYDEARHLVSYDMQINEGPLFTMGTFEVATRDERLAEKLRALWQLREGEPFDYEYYRGFYRKLGGLMAESTNERQYVLEQSEGEKPNTVDVTVVECRPGACHLNAPQLYTPIPESSTNHEDHPR